MNWKPGYLLTAGLIVSLAFITTGCPDVCCNTARGGGSIVIGNPDQKPPHKATFGFQMVCKKNANGDNVVSGQLEYQDHRLWTKTDCSPDRNPVLDENGNPVMLSVSFHGVLTDPADFTDPSGTPIECTGKKGAFKGTYKPQPESIGPGGTFTVEVEDLGKEGPSDGDFFKITVEDGVFGCYSQSGYLAGGNVKTF